MKYGLLFFLFAAPIHSFAQLDDDLLFKGTWEGVIEFQDSRYRMIMDLEKSSETGLYKGSATCKIIEKDTRRKRSINLKCEVQRTKSQLIFRAKPSEIGQILAGRGGCLLFAKLELNLNDEKKYPVISGNYAVENCNFQYGDIKLTRQFSDDELTRFTRSKLANDSATNKDFAFWRLKNMNCEGISGKNQSQFDQERTNALDKFYGINAFNEPGCRRTLYQLCKAGDFKSIAWESLFSLDGSCGFLKSKNDALFWITRGNGCAFKNLYNSVLDHDPESSYLLASLLSYSLYPSEQLGNITNIEKQYADSLMQVASQMNYLPATYAIALQLMQKKKYTEGLALLETCYAKGFQKAGFNLALFYENLPEGSLVPEASAKKKADSIYKILLTKENNDAIIRVSEMKLKTAKSASDAKQGLSLLQRAVNNGSVPAMMFLADYHLNIGDSSIRNQEAINILKLAVDNGDKNGEAMYRIALLYLKEPNVENRKKGYGFLNRSALDGNAEASWMLSLFLEKGSEFTEKDYVKSRYWQTLGWNSKLARAEIKNAKPTQSITDAVAKLSIQAFVNGVANYKPTEWIETEIHPQTGVRTEVRRSSDFATDMLAAGLAVVAVNALAIGLSKANKPKHNAIYEMAEKISPDSSETIISRYLHIFNSVEIKDIRKGDIITLKPQFTSVDLFGYTNYYLNGVTGDNYLRLATKSKDYLWGAVLMSFNNNEYELVGPNKTFRPVEDGTLKLVVNDQGEGSLLVTSFFYDITIKRKKN
jgi:TPR repeat protein